MKKSVLIIDSCILCVWLKVKGMEVCHSKNGDTWDFKRVDGEIRHHIDSGAQLVLPFATIIETGNHIHHQDKSPEVIDAFCTMIMEAITGEKPWVALNDSNSIMSEDHVGEMLEMWKQDIHNGKGQSMGDAYIVSVAKYFSSVGFSVTILTADTDLKVWEAQINTRTIPRRRR